MAQPVTDGNNLLHGLVVQPLRVIEDARGAVLHMLREDWPVFTRFGEVYFSEVKPNVVKGWKWHSAKTQRFAVPVGRVKLVLYDDRSDSPTAGRFAEYELGRPDAYVLVIVPPRVWYAFTAVGESTALMANCADQAHAPEALNPEVPSPLIEYVWPE
jgi:dTDP-4-dehydrorhamnose 3,5-epimerase